MLEREFWASVKNGLGQIQGTMLDRLENELGSGIPDVTACCGGRDAWLELKVFKGNFLWFRTSQRVWITKAALVGRRVFVLARDGDYVKLYDAFACMQAEHTPYAQRKAFSVHRDKLPSPLFFNVKPINWANLHAIIFQKGEAQTPK